MFNGGVKGLPADGSAAPTIDIPVAANQAEMEAASSTTKFTTPGTERFHPGVAKAWAHVTISGGTPTLAAGHNFSSSITDHGAGDFTLTFTTAMSSAFFAAIATAERSAAYHAARISSMSTTTVRVLIADPAGTLVDPTAFSIVVFGDFT